MKYEKHKFDWNDLESQKLFEADTDDFKGEDRFDRDSKLIVKNYGLQNYNR